MDTFSPGQTDEAPAVVVSNITKSFGPLRAVDRLDFTVSPMTCFGLLGPNGAGKTTMMKMLYGKCRRDSADTGSLSVFGYDPHTDELPIKYTAGVVSQENNLDEELNVTKNLQIYAKFYGIPRKDIRTRIEELLDFMELSDKRTTRIRELSGGMKRRLVIARALLNNPRLLILDEPTTGLDPQVRHLIWEKLRNLKKVGMTILLTTHYMEEAAQLCDTVCIMHKAQKILEGPPRALVEKEIERYVLELIGRDVLEECSQVTLPEGVRIDDSVESVRLYANDSTLLEPVRQVLKPGRYFFRESNLEDVFLNATGRVLNARQ